MKKIALALLSFVLAAATWAGLYAFFFSVGKGNYVAVIATYGVLPILFLTKAIYDSVQPSARMQAMGLSARMVASVLSASAIWAVIFLGCLWASEGSTYDDYSLAPFAIIVVLPAVFLAKVIYDTLTRAIDWVVEH